MGMGGDGVNIVGGRRAGVEGTFGKGGRFHANVDYSQFSDRSEDSFQIPHRRTATEEKKEKENTIF
jgi:hypothetical protein